jgi:hypothetical protein
MKNIEQGPNGRVTQEALITEREVFELMNKQQLVDYILSQGERVSAVERSMNLAGEVLEGYGTSVEEELKKRERKNGKS